MYWSEQLVPKCPYKITASNKGASGKVKVTGQGLKGGYVGQELHLDVDTTEAGFGKFSSYRIHGLCYFFVKFEDEITCQNIRSAIVQSKITE